MKRVTPRRRSIETHDMGEIRVCFCNSDYYNKTQLQQNRLASVLQ